MRIFRTKSLSAPIDELMPHEHMMRCLSAMDLTLLGIGAVIGAGIFILTGVVAATQAGPAITLSFIVAGCACAFSALSYAELAATIGGCGGAYGYAFAGFGEVFAWIIGWDLILEYGIATAAVAIGWSAYFNNIATALGHPVADRFLNGPFNGGILNFPAVAIVLCISVLLAVGVKASARFNAIMVIIKLAVIGFFIIVASRHVNFSHWKVFMPYGWQGVFNGAAMIFFAYIGFDAVATAAEEAKNPRRDLPIGILASLFICTLIYIVVSGMLTLITHYSHLEGASPVSTVILDLGHNIVASFIAVGALAGLTTVILVIYYALTRVFLAMSRDKLLSPIFSHLNCRTKTPARVILLCGLVIASVAGLYTIGVVAELVNIGTLAAFAMVNAGVLAIRYRKPELDRPFKVPGGPVVPILGILFCVYLMAQLPLMTWLRFLGWMGFGGLIYTVHVFRETLQQKKARF